MLIGSEVARKVVGPARISDGTFRAHDGVAIIPAKIADGGREGWNDIGDTSWDADVLAPTVHARVRGAGVVIVDRTVIGCHATSAALLRDVLTRVVDVTEVGRAGIAVAAVLVLRTAGVIDQELALGRTRALPLIAGRGAIGVHAALDLQ